MSKTIEAAIADQVLGSLMGVEAEAPAARGAPREPVRHSTSRASPSRVMPPRAGARAQDVRQVGEVFVYVPVEQFYVAGMAPVEAPAGAVDGDRQADLVLHGVPCYRVRFEDGSEKRYVFRGPWCDLWRVLEKGGCAIASMTMVPWEWVEAEGVYIKGMKGLNDAERHWTKAEFGGWVRGSSSDTKVHDLPFAAV